MNEQQVIELMKSSKSLSEWNKNADTVKTQCGGYPHFWYNAIEKTMLFDKVSKTWKS